MSAAQNVKTSLEEARCEVHKSCSEMDVIGNLNEMLDLCVRRDGSTSKYGVDCCIEVTTGLVMDFTIVSKFCNLCEQNKVLLGDHSVEFDMWFQHHKSNCNSSYQG